MRQSQILGLAIFFITAGVMVVLTAIRYNSRDNDDTISGGEVQAGSSGMLRDVKWDDLPSVDEFALTERSGKTIGNSDLSDGPYVVSFFFTSCPSICREQNTQLAQLAKGYADQDVTLLSITCDPDNDTPVKLREYAKTFQADPNQWLFLTGTFDDIKSFSEGSFQTALSTTTHGTNLMLVDRWGRFRDRFDWQDPQELIRLRTVLDEVLAETEPPEGKQIRTRTPAPGSQLDHGHGATNDIVSNDTTTEEDRTPESEYQHGPWRDQDWIEEFTLTERSGKLFHSKDMDGRVWIASFFFVSCPSICKQQNQHIADLQRQMGDRDVTFLSITSDPENDTPVRLREYAKTFDADEEKWLFVTGDRLHIRRIAGEYFTGMGFMTPENHSTKMAVIDKWGNNRGSFGWSNPDELLELRKTVDRLLAETQPPEEDSTE